MKNKLAKRVIVAIMMTTMSALLAVPAVMAAPSTSGNTTASASGTTSTPKPPKPYQGQVILDNLADTLGRELTEGEANEIKLALDTAREKIQANDNKLVSDLSSAFGLTADKVKEALKTRAPLVETLSKLVGRKLTSDEVKLMKAALQARHEATKVAHNELIATIGSVTGLTNDDVAQALLPPPPPKPADKPNDKPADKPNCKPGTEQNGQQSGQQGNQQSGQQGGQQNGRPAASVVKTKCEM